MTPKEYAADLIERMNHILHDKQKSIQAALFVAREITNVSEHCQYHIACYWREIKQELENM